MVLHYTDLRLMLKTSHFLLSVLHDLTVRWRNHFTGQFVSFKKNALQLLKLCVIVSLQKIH
jgi:hypothetical protein